MSAQEETPPAPLLGWKGGKNGTSPYFRPASHIRVWTLDEVNILKVSLETQKGTENGSLVSDNWHGTRGIYWDEPPVFYSHRFTGAVVDTAEQTRILDTLYFDRPKVEAAAMNYVKAKNDIAGFSILGAGIGTAISLAIAIPLVELAGVGVSVSLGILFAALAGGLLVGGVSAFLISREVIHKRLQAKLEFQQGIELTLPRDTRASSILFEPKAAVPNNPLNETARLSATRQDPDKTAASTDAKNNEAGRPSSLSKGGGG